MRYFMSVHQVNNPHQESWLAIPARGATDSSIFHPNMLSAKTPSMIYKEATLNNYTLMRLKWDTIVNHVLDSRLEKETVWKRKKSSIVEDSSIFTKNLEQNKFSLPENHISNNKRYTSLNKAKKANKELLKEQFRKLWNEKVEELLMQETYQGN